MAFHHYFHLPCALIFDIIPLLNQYLGRVNKGACIGSSLTPMVMRTQSELDNLAAEVSNAMEVNCCNHNSYLTVVII